MDDRVLYAIVGAIGTVLFNLLLNVIGNLITPDRRRLADWVRDWWARRSDKRTRKRIKELEERLETLSEYAANQELLSLHLWRTVFGMLSVFSLVAIIAFSFQLFSGVNFLLGLMACALLIKAYVECDKAAGLARRVRSYDSYRTSIEQQTAELQERIRGVLEIAGTWKGVFCGEQSGVLDIKQDGNHLQAVLTTDCLHLGTDEVYQEKLSGTIRGRKVTLVGESVSSARQERIDYALDNFELTLLPDEKALAGRVSDKDGSYDAEFERELVPGAAT